jgi:hypothetical protein
MSVIAWDGSTLAADKRIINGGIAKTCTKIFRHEKELLGITGDWDVGAELREWYKAGADPQAFPAEARTDGGRAGLSVFDGKTVRVYSTGPFPLVVEDKHFAAGSGRDFAYAAMYLGRGAVEAVRVASVFQTDCGSGYDLLTLHGDAS